MCADRPTANWHEQDTFWEGIASLQFSGDLWDTAPQQVEQVLALAQLEPPLHVLDMPCGMGRHTLEFARLGCAVTGVDRTALYLAHVREKIDAVNMDVRLVEADMRVFQQPASFDLAVNLYTSFGYFEDAADDLKVLTNFYTSLRPGGALVMEMLGKEILARIFTPRDWYAEEDGTLILREHRISRNWMWLERRWIMIKDGLQREYTLANRLYGASDLHNALTQAGFTGIRIYGSLSGTSYDHTAQRLVIVAHKPEGA